MGLDAVVYKNRAKLPLDPEQAGLKLDESTGEWYSTTDELPDAIKAEGLEAIHKHLGNVSQVAALAAEVGRFISPKSVLLGNILYSGSHAGDVVPPDKIDALKHEIAMLREASTLSPELTIFLNDLDELIRVAKENYNPVAFV